MDYIYYNSCPRYKVENASKTKSEEAGSEPISLTKVEMSVAWTKRLAIGREGGGWIWKLFMS